MKAATAKAKEAVDLAELVRKQQRHYKSGRLAYERADALLNQIGELVGDGGTIPLGENGQRAVITDRFAKAARDKKPVFTPAMCRRWEIEIKPA